MSIDVTGATSYFSQHMRAQVWNGFADPQRTAAIAHAKRVLNRAINSDIDNEPVDTTDYSFRPDYAVYEQALWMLENGVIANGEQSAPAFIASDPEKPDNARDSQKAMISPEAMRWLGIGPMIHLARG